MIIVEIELSQQALNDNELINLAYAMAVEPQRMEQLMEMLDIRLQHHLDDDDITAPKIEPVDDLADHFERAMALLERHDGRQRHAQSSLTFMDFDDRPCATVNENGAFNYVNKSAQTALGWQIGQAVKTAFTDPDEYQRFMKALEELNSVPQEQFIGLFYMSGPSRETPPLQFALSGAINEKGQTIGRLSTVQLKISSETAEEFQQALGLTSTELSITQAIVSGQSLADIADERDRSVSTVRTQLKGLLAKANVHSQVELACFYSAFAQFSIRKNQNDISSNGLPVGDRKSHILERPGGRKVCYEIAGPLSGRPVIYFHALGGGNAVTQSMFAELHRYNIKLIMPWRPHFDDSCPVTPFDSGLAIYSEDIAALMNTLDIETCTFLTNVSGTIWAYAAAAHLGSRVSHITVTAGAVPLTGKQLKRINFRQRGSIQLARHAPRLLPFTMRAAVAKIDAGFDQEFLQEHYKKSPIDQEVLRSDELKALFRMAHAQITKQGHSSLVQELYHMGQMWDDVMHRVPCKVSILQGQHDPSFPPEIVEENIRNRGNFSLEIIPDSAQFLIYQFPEIVFDKVNQMIPA